MPCVLNDAADVSTIHPALEFSLAGREVHLACFAKKNTLAIWGQQTHFFGDATFFGHANSLVTHNQPQASQTVLEIRYCIFVNKHLPSIISNTHVFFSMGLPTRCEPNQTKTMGHDVFQDFWVHVSCHGRHDFVTIFFLDCLIYDI